MAKVLKVASIDNGDGTFTLKNIKADNIGCGIEITDVANGTARLTIVINIDSGAFIIEDSVNSAKGNYYYELIGNGTVKNSLAVNLTKKDMAPTATMQNSQMNFVFTNKGKAGGTIVGTVTHGPLSEMFKKAKKVKPLKK